MSSILDSIGDIETIFHDMKSKITDADYSETLDAFQPTIAAQEAEMFSSQRDSNGSPWAPLKPSTVKRKGHSRILFESGALMASLVTVGGPGNINAVSERGLLYGTDIEYAIFHQDGTSKMPARPPVGLSEETLTKLCDRIADKTVEILGS